MVFSPVGWGLGSSSGVETVAGERSPLRASCAGRGRFGSFAGPARNGQRWL